MSSNGSRHPLPPLVGGRPAYMRNPARPQAVHRHTRARTHTLLHRHSHVFTHSQWVRGQVPFLPRLLWGDPLS